MSQFKTYIDKNYYTQGYKPSIQASIESKYTLGERNEANFESFSQRASEAVNRLTNNTIERLGGVDVLAPFPQTLVMKATAALVEYWYLNDFNLGIIDSEFTAGAASADSVSTKKIKTTTGMRAFIPETVLWLLQTSGLTDQTWIGVTSDSELMSGVTPGFSITDFFTKEETVALFQQKGEYDNNFHKDIIIQNDLGTAGTPRYFKIFEGVDGQTSATFSIIGGNEKSVLGAKMIVSVTETNGTININESSVVTLNPKANDITVAAGEPEFIASIENGHIVVYVETKSGQDINDILVTDITPDTSGLFKLYTASDNLPQGDLLPKQAVVQSQATQTNLQDQIDANKGDIADNKAKIDAFDITTLAGKDELNAVEALAQKGEQAINVNIAKIATNASDITNLGATKQDITDADDKYIIRDTNANTEDSARMSAGYIPVNTQDVAVKRTVDTLKTEINSTLGDMEARLAGLETDTLTSENFIDGNFALTGDSNSGTLSAALLIGSTGTFNLNSGQTIEISAFDKINGLGGSAKVVVGKTNPQSISLASGGGTSETVGVDVDTNGIITISETTNGVDVSNDIVIDRIAQLTVGSVSGTNATKAEVALKQNITIGTYTGTANTVETALNENRQLIDANTGDVATNKADIATNKSDIVTNTADIATNKSKSDNNEADIAELNKGNFDINADGTDIVELFGNNVRIGLDAGQTNQGNLAVAVGQGAGFTNQGDYAVAIGSGAGERDQPNNSIVINASSSFSTNAANEGDIILQAKDTKFEVLHTGVAQINGKPIGGTWVDIKNTWETRQWKPEDFGKPFRCHIQAGRFFSGMVVVDETRSDTVSFVGFGGLGKNPKLAVGLDQGVKFIRENDNDLTSNNAIFRLEILE